MKMKNNDCPYDFGLLGIMEFSYVGNAKLINVYVDCARELIANSDLGMVYRMDHDKSYMQLNNEKLATFMVSYCLCLKNRAAIQLLSRKDQDEIFSGPLGLVLEIRENESADLLDLLCSRADDLLLTGASLAGTTRSGNGAALMSILFGIRNAMDEDRHFPISYVVNLLHFDSLKAYSLLCDLGYYEKFVQSNQG